MPPSSDGVEHISCQICGADETRLVFQLPVQPYQKGHFARDTWNIVQCKKCGLIYENPRSDAAELKDYYELILSGDHQFAQSWFIDAAPLQTQPGSATCACSNATAQAASCSMWAAGPVPLW